MPDSKLIIKNPCDESWDAMTPKGNGRHCASCNKIVVDFSKMPSEEIKDYFKKANGERVCGQFNSSQVLVIRPKHHLFLIQLYQKIEAKFKIPYIKTIPLYCVMFALFLVGCKSKTTGEPLIKKDSKNETKEDDSQTTTDVMVFPIPDLEKENKTENKCSVETKTEHSIEMTVGFVEPIVVEPEVIDTFKIEKLKPITMGKVVIEDSVKKKK